MNTNVVVEEADARAAGTAKSLAALRNAAASEAELRNAAASEADKYATILRRLHALPPEARFTPEEAAIYINARLDLLRAWRSAASRPPLRGPLSFHSLYETRSGRFYGRLRRHDASGMGRPPAR